MPKVRVAASFRVVSAIAVLATATLARAQEVGEAEVGETIGASPEGADAPVEELGPGDAPDEAEDLAAADPGAGGTHWQSHWPRFHWAEGLATVVAEGSALAIYFAEPNRSPGWSDPMPLDTAFREAFRLESLEDQQTVLEVSDWMFWPMLVWPVAVDAVLLAGAVRGDWDTAWQMSLIDAETMAIAHLVTWATTRFTGRIRPRHLECAPNDSCADRGVGPVASFVSGHALMAYAASGLICSHHATHPWIVGSIAGAGAMCAASIGLATAIGAMRVMTDLHWASDVAIGALMGSTIGWGVPFLLHYARFRPELPGGVAVIPGGAGDLGVSLRGAL